MVINHTEDFYVLISGRPVFFRRRKTQLRRTHGIPGSRSPKRFVLRVFNSPAACNLSFLYISEFRILYICSIFIFQKRKNFNDGILINQPIHMGICPSAMISIFVSNF